MNDALRKDLELIIQAIRGPMYSDIRSVSGPIAIMIEQALLKQDGNPGPFPLLDWAEEHKE